MYIYFQTACEPHKGSSNKPATNQNTHVRLRGDVCCQQGVMRNIALKEAERKVKIDIIVVKEEESAKEPERERLQI